VPPAAATTVTLQTRPGTSFYGQPIQLAAKVAGATGGTVQFFDNGSTTPLDAKPISVVNGYARFSISTLEVGSHSIVAQYDDGSGHTTSSSAVAETVRQAMTRTLVTASPKPYLRRPMVWKAKAFEEGPPVPPEVKGKGKDG
jgi:hypothetical protein